MIYLPSFRISHFVNKEDPYLLQSALQTILPFMFNTGIPPEGKNQEWLDKQSNNKNLLRVIEKSIKLMKRPNLVSTFLQW